MPESTTTEQFTEAVSELFDQLDQQTNYERMTDDEPMPADDLMAAIAADTDKEDPR